MLRCIKYCMYIYISKRGIESLLCDSGMGYNNVKLYKLIELVLK